MCKCAPLCASSYAPLYVRYRTDGNPLRWDDSTSRPDDSWAQVEHRGLAAEIAAEIHPLAHRLNTRWLAVWRIIF